MPVTPDSEAFLQAVREYVGPYTGQFNYNDMLFAFSDKTRFYPLAGLIDQYHRISGARVLSSGCGFGGNLVAYWDQGARLVVGLEVDPHFVRLAGIRVRPLSRAALVHYDGDRLPFADGSFDIVDSIQVLEHVEDPRHYLHEILRVMRPGAVCYIEFPNRLYPLEQHSNVPLVNWLPKSLGDALSSWMSKLPFLTPQQSSRLQVVRSISNRYVTLFAIYRLLSSDDVQLHCLPPFHPLLRLLCRVPALRFLLPNTTVRVIFRKNKHT